MRITILGCRGSTPTPGAAFVRYGGDTSCVALARHGAAPSLILDAGTGLRHLSGLLGPAAFRGSVLLGHLHWDHTHGLPFAPAVDRDDARVDLYLPAQCGADAEALLARAMGPPHFPITPAGLRGSWTFTTLEEGTSTVDGFSVLAREIPHTPGRTFGYRVTADGVSVAYLSDHHPGALGPGGGGFGPVHDAARALAWDADLLIHDAQYTAGEYPARASFGHSAVDYAMELADACGVGRLLLYHHDPARTDELTVGLPDGVAVARQGMVLYLVDAPDVSPSPPTGAGRTGARAERR